MLEDMDFADGVALLLSNHSDIQQKMDQLSSLASEIGLRVNVRKTKLMRLNTTNNQLVTVSNRQLEEVNEFTYPESSLY